VSPLFVIKVRNNTSGCLYSHYASSKCYINNVCGKSNSYYLWLSIILWYRGVQKHVYIIPNYLSPSQPIF